VTITVLKSHRRRCTFEIALETERSRHAVIAKAYARDRVDILQAMEAFGRAGFGPEDDFSIPQPLTHLSGLGVRLEERVQGTSAKELFLRGNPQERGATAERCASWLARFQMVAPPLRGKVTDPAVQLSRWQSWTDDVAAAHQGLGDKCRLLLQKLTAAVPPPGTFTYCASHGSYIPEHVLLCGRRTAAIDLDEHGMADPAREVAWFVISLQRLALKHLGSFHALDDLREHFLNAYVRVGHEAIPHYGFYRAAECLHRGRRDVVGRTPPALEWAEIMLDEGLRAV
jgi:aminoglycoside phosphotransferase (APT) family kinase protein